MQPLLSRRGTGTGVRLHVRPFAVEHLEHRTLLSAKTPLAKAVLSVSPTFVVKSHLSAKSNVRPTAAAASSTLGVPYTPSELVQAYGINSINFNGVTGNGSGQTIAIIDAYNDPDIVADAATFSSVYGLPAFNTGSGPTLTVLNETGGTTLPTNAAPGTWDVEESLDVEWAHSIAPQANLVLYEAASNGDADLFTAAANAAKATGVSVVSMSFGGSEFSGETSEDSNFLTPVGHQGVTFLASTGDSGEPGSYPAYSPNVVAVGGTSLTINGDGSYGGETGWSDSGGGISQYESQPTYQAGNVNGLSSSKRTTPDVSMDANPSTGVIVLDSFYGGTNGWYTVGGTSLAAPSWAGVIAIADQGRVLNGLGTLDGVSQTLPDLYNAPSTQFHDIVSGSNGYSATAGYDLVTGRGSPVAGLLVQSLAGNASGSRLVFAQQPAGTSAGSTLSAITVDVEDGKGNLITTNEPNVTLSIYTGPTGATLWGTTTVQAVNGVATFNNDFITAAGNYVLEASTTSAAAVSNSFAITPASAAALSFVQQPTTTAVNAAISPALTVKVTDAYGNIVTSDTSTVSLSIASGPSGATLGGTLSVQNVNGVATFSNVELNTAGTYTLEASDTFTNGLLTAVSNSFSVYVNAPAKLVFATVPATSGVVGMNLGTIVVDVENQAGVIQAGDSSNVTLSMAGGPAGGTIGGLLAVAAVSGVATFNSVYVTAPGSYTLLASDGSLQSAMANVSAKGSYVQSKLLDFNGSSYGLTDGQPVIDSRGNIFIPAEWGWLNANGGEILEIPAGSSTPQTLVSFPTGGAVTAPGAIVLDSAGDIFGTAANSTGHVVYEIPAGTSTFTTLASMPYGSAGQLLLDGGGDIFGTSSSGGASGYGYVWEIVKGSSSLTTLASFSTNVSGVQSNLVMDPAGNLYGTTYLGGAYNEGSIFEVAKGSGAITTLASFPGTAPLYGSPNGNLLIDSAGNLYGTSLMDVFKLAKGSSSITSIAAGTYSAEGIDGLVMDGKGNLFGASNEIGSPVWEVPAGTNTFTVLAGTEGYNGGAFSGIAVDGQGNIFGACSDGGSAYNYNGNNFTTANFGLGTILEFKAPHLSFTQQPGSTMTAGQNIAPAVAVHYVDANGNPITSDTAGISLSLTGTSGGALLGTTSATASNGVANFGSLSITHAGTYTLVATDALNAAVTVASSSFTVTPAAPVLSFVQQPTTTPLNTAIAPAPTVEVTDMYGNVITAPSSVTLSIGSGPSGATLGGTLSVQDVNGIATFSNAELDTAGTYTLQASGSFSGTSLSATSASFSVYSNLPFKLAFISSPTATGTVGMNLGTYTVYVENQSGALLSGNSSTVTLSLAGGPAGGTLGGVLTAAAVNGVATFSSVYVTAPGSYTLQASDGALVAAITPALVKGSYVLNTVYDFNGTGHGNPAGAPVIDSAGDLFFSAVDGVPGSGGGAILEIPAGSRTPLTLDSFSSTDPVHYPGQLILDSTGDIFGMASSGQSNTSHCIFEIPAGTSTVETVAQVSTSAGDLMLDPAGNMYGFCSSGGANGDGYLWEIARGTSTLTTLASFSTSVSTQTNLVMDAAGDLYGTTYQGGSYNEGSIFELSHGSGTITTLASFPGTAPLNGFPMGKLLIDSAGNLYGTSFMDVFRFVKSTNTLASFATAPSSAANIDDLVMDANGNLFGGSEQVGSPIWEVPNGSNVLTALAGTDGYDGGAIGGLVIDAQGNIYATCSNGGSAYNYNGSNYGTANFGLGTLLELEAPHLSFAQQPTNTEAGVNLTPAVTVEYVDANGNLITSDSPTLAMSVSGSSNSLRGTITATPVNGVATFNNLFTDRAGTYQLMVTDAANAAVNRTSATFNVSTGTISGWVITQTPSNTTAGATLTPALTAEIVDVYGNLVTTDTSSVTVSVISGPGVLTGTTTVNAVGGIATFNNLAFLSAGSFSLRVGDGGYSSPQTAPIVISPGPAARLFFAQPQLTSPGSYVDVPFGNWVSVDVLDAYGNLETGDNSNVTLTVASGPGNLHGTTTVAAVGGVATFSSAYLDTAGSYTLSATDGQLQSATSVSFANQLAPTSITLSELFNGTPNASQTLNFSIQSGSNIPDGEAVALEDAGNGDAVLGSAVMSDGGAVVTLAPGTLLAGSHTLIAAYGGDNVLAASTSNTVTVTVQAVVTGVVVNGNLPALAGPQRSMVNSLVYSFSEPVVAGGGAFSIAVHSGQTGTVPVLAWTPVSPDQNGAASQWVVSFSGAGVVGGSIANGVYDITPNPAALVSEADPSATVAPRPADTFYRLFGDFTGTRSVNFSDLLALGQSYKAAAGSPNYHAFMDADGSGVIDFADLLTLGQDYGQSFSF